MKLLWTKRVVTCKETIISCLIHVFVYLLIGTLIVNTVAKQIGQLFLEERQNEIVSTIERNYDKNLISFPVMFPYIRKERPGYMGKPVVLPHSLSKDIVKLMTRNNRHNGFHQYQSDLIGYHRTLPDYRDEWCKVPNRFPKDLQSTSIIIPVYIETWSTLIRTVNSIITNSPPELIHEIILVVDYSDLAHLKTLLEDHFNTYHFFNFAHESKVKITHTKKREGLIRAKNIGAQQATGQVLTFLDSHCECTKGWLEPLLDRIARNSTAVAIPVTGEIKKETFEYSPPSSMAAGFNWELVSKPIPIPQREILRRIHKAEPFYTPVIHGGLFSVNRSFFAGLGGFDGGLELWGGENMEISFKAWMCGGCLEVVPCSQIGHVFKNQYVPYHQSYESFDRNLGRVAKVWMDDHLEYFYERIKLAGVGDVSLQKGVRRMLNCKSFDWYLKNVYPEMINPKDCPFYGDIKSVVATEGGVTTNKEEGVERVKVCLDSLGEPNQTIGLYPCHGMKGHQCWLLTKAGEIRQYDSCLEYSGEGLYLRECDGLKENQFWKYSQETKLLEQGSGQLCLAVGEDRKIPVMLKCDDKDQKQLWVLDNYDPSKEV